VAYPTDAGLLAKAVGEIAATGRRIRAASGATRTKLGDRSRTGEAGARGCVEGAIAGRGRTRGCNGCGEEANAELADLADRPADEAGQLLGNAKWALPSRPAFMVERPNLESLGFDCDRRASRGAAVGC
jgi:IS5 family transposase